MRRKKIADTKQWKPVCGYNPIPKANASFRILPAVWVPAIVALIVAVIAPFLTYKLGLNSQLKLTGKQKRQQAYSELMGHRALITQLLYSRFEAYIYSDAHEERWHMEGEPNDSFDSREAQRWMHKSEDLAIEIAKSRKSLYDTLGLIRSYFPHWV